VGQQSGSQVRAVPARRAGSAVRLGAVALAALAGLGASVACVVRRQPVRAARVVAGRGPVLFSARSTTRQVAVTIDDGPTPDLTPRVLEVLSAHDARATFFVLGSGVQAHPGLARDVLSAGHEIGNHGWLDRPAGLLSRAALANDLARTSSAIESATGIRPRFMRPGSGWMRPGHLRDVRAGGATVALGSIAVLDLEVRDPDRELAFVLARLRPGAVIVLHEGRAERAGVVPLLDRLLAELARRGYVSVTLSDLVDGTTARAIPSASH
jgi:peptidoglycan-N-acetylglucosamine deacetylase